MKHNIKMQKSLIHVLFICLLSAISINGQIIQWTQTYGGAGDDGSFSMLTTNDGGIVIAGFKSPGAYLRNDILLMKTDAAGNEVWSRIFNPNLNDIARAIRQTSDGGFIIAGMTEVSPQIFDPFLLKTDGAGNMQWIRQYDYGFGRDDRAHDVWPTSDGGYVIAGQTRIFHGPFANYDMYIIKTDMNGNVQWNKIYYREEEDNDVALSIQQLSDGGYIIGGFTQSSIWAAYVIRTNSSGDSIWSNIYPGSWQSECYDIQPTPDGGFIFTGTESSYQTDTDVLITKLAANGTLVWKKIYGNEGAEQGNSILQLPGGGYIVAGMGADELGYDMYVIRTNSTGDSLWSRKIGGSGDDRAFSVVSPQPGNFYVSGWAWSFGQGMGDVYLAKLTESLTGNIEINSIPKTTALNQNFPNPFNPSTVISYRLADKNNVKLHVYDITGKTISTLVDENQNAGTYQVSFSGNNLPSGIYFYTLFINGNRVDSKKMMLVK